MAYIITPSKGDFLVLTVMNLAGYHDANSHREFHPLRDKVMAHFAGERDNPFILKATEQYIAGQNHPSPPPGYRLHLLRKELGMPGLCYEGLEQDAEIFEGFRKSTDFDGFYAQIAKEHSAICDEVRGVLAPVPIERVVQDAWEMPAFDGIIVPQPLEGPYAGEGQRVLRFAAAFIGPGDVNGKLTFNDVNLRRLVAHEFSHTYAEKVWKEIEEIAKARGLETRLADFSSKQKSKGYNGRDVLIETMMRAMQDFYIDPHIMDLPVVPDEEIVEHENVGNGFRYTSVFDDAIREHRATPRGETLAQSIFTRAIEPIM